MNELSKTYYSSNLIYLWLLSSFFCLMIQAVSHAQTIELGMSTSLSGPNQLIGHAMHEGMRAYFEETNRQGGVNGRKINLNVLDDGYEPDSARTNTLKFIKDYKVIALVGNVGTPTAAVSTPLANEHGVVFFGAFTGADILRKIPPDPYVFNFRASYQQEIDVIVQDIIERGISPYQIAFFLQDDSFGQTGYDNAAQALIAHGFMHTDQLLVTRYPRNTLAIQNAMHDLIYARSDLKAVIMIGAYKPIAQFIRFAHRVFPDTLFYSISFSGANLLTQALNGIHDRIYMTQVVPPVITHETKIPTYGNEQNLIWQEGYLSAQILVKALEQIQGEITGSTLKTALEAMGTFELDQFGTLFFSADNHQASRLVWLTHLDHTLNWTVVNPSEAKH